MVMGAFDDIVKQFDTLQIEFSKLSLGEVYELQQEAMMEIHLLENVVVYHETKQQRKAKQCKALLKEKEQEIKVCNHSRVVVAEAIKGMAIDFPPEAGQEDEYLAVKVTRLSQLIMELKKQVEELQVRQVPSTPHDVLEE